MPLNLHDELNDFMTYLFTDVLYSIGIKNNKITHFSFEIN